MVFGSILIIVGIIAFGVIWLIGAYNSLVTLKNRAQNAFSQIDVQLKRRYDLIPNLIEIAKKYLSHEQETLMKVIEARNTAKSALDNVANNAPDAINALNNAEKSLQNALMNFNMTIVFARQAYNDNVTNFNTCRQIFPNNIIVGFFSQFAKDLPLLEFEENREVLNQAPKVQF